MLMRLMTRDYTHPRVSGVYIGSPAAQQPTRIVGAVVIGVQDSSIAERAVAKLIAEDATRRGLVALPQPQPLVSTDAPRASATSRRSSFYIAVSTRPGRHVFALRAGERDSPRAGASTTPASGTSTIVSVVCCQVVAFWPRTGPKCELLHSPQPLHALVGCRRPPPLALVVAMGRPSRLDPRVSHLAVPPVPRCPRGLGCARRRASWR